ncbi:MAG: glycosyltransferase [Arcobacteraceae bacterium]
MNLAASVVLYNPIEEVFDNIKSYADFVDTLILIDNSDKRNINLINNLVSHYKDKLIYIDNKKNLGIATALNIASNKAISLGYQWLLTMDQDSAFINFEHYKDCLLSIENCSDIGLLAANTTRNAKEQCPLNPSMKYEEKFIVITSANIINLKYFDAIGHFDDKLFIDMVDYDFCAKIRKENLRILYFKDVLVEHALGEVFLRQNLLTRKSKLKREHNSQRAYYIARNSLYLSKKYRNIFPEEFALLKTINIIFIHDLTKILLYEEDKINKIKAKFIALYHFLIGKYGKYNLKLNRNNKG